MERWEAMLDRVLELALLLSQDANEGLASLGLTTSRAHLVWELQHRGPCTQRVLADALHVAPRTITTLIDALVETGFVTREPHPTDRRATLITFTPRGRETAQALVDGHERLARELFADLPAGVLESFDTGLTHVVARLHRVTAARRSGAPAPPAS